MSESAVKDGLEGEPLDGHSSALGVIHVLVHVQQLSQTEVGDLNLQRLRMGWSDYNVNEAANGRIKRKNKRKKRKKKER